MKFFVTSKYLFRYANELLAGTEFEKVEWQDNTGYNMEMEWICHHYKEVNGEYIHAFFQYRSGEIDEYARLESILVRTC